MKIWEALREAQENGAKVRIDTWKPNQYIFYSSDVWFHQDLSVCDILYLGKWNWELYIEPIKTFGPDRAMYWLERGRRLKREAWKSIHTIFRDNEHILGTNWATPTSEWFHNDWHLCDENGNYIPEPEEEK